MIIMYISTKLFGHVNVSIKKNENKMNTHKTEFTLIKNSSLLVVQNVMHFMSKDVKCYNSTGRPERHREIRSMDRTSPSSLAAALGVHWQMLPFYMLTQENWALVDRSTWRREGWHWMVQNAMISRIDRYRQNSTSVVTVTRCYGQRQSTTLPEDNGKKYDELFENNLCVKWLVVGFSFEFNE